MVRALSACNSSSLTLYVCCKRRQNHFSMFLVVKNNCYKINSNLDHLPKQRWQIDALGVLEGVIGEIVKLSESCYIATAQGALYEYNEVEIRRKDHYLAWAPAHNLKDMNKSLRPTFLCSTGGCGGRFLHETGIAHVRASVPLWKWPLDYPHLTFPPDNVLQQR